MSPIKTPIYMDYQATTPLDERVLARMMPYLTGRFGNPHSVGHRFGWEAMAAIDVARRQVGELIGADGGEITFLSGATEANNLAIKGVMDAFLGKKDHLITVATEHKCVLESSHAVAKNGRRLTVLMVGDGGLIDLDDLDKAITDETALVSVMAVNNEIGVIQPIAEIGALCRDGGALFHCDAAQAFGKIPLNVKAMEIDLMSISGHKIYGPKGIGAIYVRSRPKVPLVPQMSGGGQERGIRSGTLSPALCVGLGEAAVVAADEMNDEASRIDILTGTFREAVLEGCPGAVVNGSLEHRYSGNLNISFPGLDGDLLIAKLSDLAISSGAACASAETGPSYVLQAIGCSVQEAESSIRFGFGRFTTKAEVDFAADLVIEVVTALGGLAPQAPKAIRA